MTSTRVIFQNEGYPGFCYVFDGKDFYWFEAGRGIKIDYDDIMKKMGIFCRELNYLE